MRYLILTFGLFMIQSITHSQTENLKLNFNAPFSEGNTADKTNTIFYDGNFTQPAGVEGNCLNFDGFTTSVKIPAGRFKNAANGFTVEAWIAPQEYSWGWTGIFDQAADTSSGFSFGINYLGKIGFQGFVNGRWTETVSPEAVPLLQWSHIAGVFNPETGFKVYIDGKLVASSAIKGKLKLNPQLPVTIGKSQRMQFPALTERKNSMQFLSNFYFDGLIDELGFTAEPLPENAIAKAFQQIRPLVKQPLQYRVMPSGPAIMKGFGAHYMHLNYCAEWDRIWPVGEYADVVVGFDNLPVRMVFWRGTGYCPAWVSSNGKWVSDQGPESWNWQTVGCFEQMSDKQCRYSYTRIIENSDARVVVHWRTASPGIDYSFNHIDPKTGWGEWTDEYYYIYPDAVAVRYQEIHSSQAQNMEWQQSEILNQPGTRPQDNVHPEAATIVNLEGQTETWSWEKAYGSRAPGSDSIVNGMIQVINLKSPERHFVIGEEGASWKPFLYGAYEGFSTIPCWNHWPVAQLPNEGRVAPVADRPSSACVGTLYPEKHKTEKPGMMIGRNLYGMTEKPAAELAILARSWNFAPRLSITGNQFENQGYNKNQRAYILRKTNEAAAGNLALTIAASEKSPVQNMSIIIENWGESAVSLNLNGKTLREKSDYNVGYRKEINQTDLVLWIKTESKNTLQLSINSK